MLEVFMLLNFATMEILHEQFHVERLAILGGGHINGGFLEVGLIDEVSLLVAPEKTAGKTRLLSLMA